MRMHREMFQSPKAEQSPVTPSQNPSCVSNSTPSSLKVHSLDSLEASETSPVLIECTTRGGARRIESGRPQSVDRVTVMGAARLMRRSV